MARRTILITYSFNKYYIYNTTIKERCLLVTKNSELQKQVYLYSLETQDFYTDEEKIISDKYFHALRIRKKMKNKKDESLKIKNFLEDKMDKEETLTLDEESLREKQIHKIKLYTDRISRINQYASQLKEQLNELLHTYEGVRVLREDSLRTNKIISLFESTLTRVCNMKINEITENLFVIRIYHYQVLKSIIHNGFLYKGIKYKYYTSSAGQIRTKKIVCINSEMYEKHENAITCGLSPAVINGKGGVNTNKYQAYLALSNSASAKWLRFNIDRIVVVDDFSTKVHAEVDYIDRDTYEITRQTMDMPIDHMDGCGIMLPTVSKKSFMFRMPWMKGLLTPFDFKKFALLYGKTKIVDIYGKEYDIIEDNINIILTKSQFKMWKYYDSWDDYKEKFKAYGCEASKLNIEDIGTDANLNYQMLQTLTTMTKDELRQIADKTINDILTLGKDKKTMLRVLGATKENHNKNYFQKSLLLYPELLTDSHSREVIKNKKRSLIKDARAGKLRVNGRYTFIIPDLYAFCEWLFLGIEVPNGLLANGDVYCDIFEEGKVDVLRSPHLYKEHAIKNNIKNEKLREWFISKGIYTSTFDVISKILMFDNDGDKGLVIQDETLVSVAEREMKGIVPLYYEMAKAEATNITSDKMFESLTSAYKANIGIISNDITKIWNSVEPNINAVKWLTMYNNFVIDYAKTLFLPKPPKEAENIIKSFTKNKVPHFFMYAKDKEEGKVERLNGSTVNKLVDLIPDKPIQFKNVAGTFNYKNLMNNKYPDQSELLIKEFTRLNHSKHNWLSSHETLSEYHFNKMMRDELFKLHRSKTYVVDVIIEHLYSKNSRFKDGLWDTFGDIIYDNLVKNLGNTIQCECCNERVEVESENAKYCDDCASKVLQIQKNKWKREKWKKS